MKNIFIKLFVMLITISLVSCSSDKWIDDDIDNIKLDDETLAIYQSAVEPYLGYDLVHDGIDMIPEKYRGYQKKDVITYRFECRDSYHDKYMFYITESDDGYVISKIEDEKGNDVTDDIIPKSF